MSGDPRPPLPSASSSSSLSSSRAAPYIIEDEGENWLDFLRTAGGTAPSDRSASADRKRRHAGSSPERPDYPRRVVWTGRRVSGMNAAAQTGRSRETAIDLTSPPRPPPMARNRRESEETLRETARPTSRPTMGSARHSNSGRQGSDIYVPQWQPDADVDRCPVCRTEFSFWYRKHHCRKCGRVVCAACSPHRITIPRQYIVQPPNSMDAERWPYSASSSPYRSLTGGEVVRVCNPCVPDPWTPGAGPEDSSSPITGQQSRTFNNDPSHWPNQYRPVPPPPPFQHARPTVPSFQPGNFSRSLPQNHPAANFPFRGTHDDTTVPTAGNYPRSSNHRYTLSAGVAVPPPPPQHPGAPPLNTRPPRPRREVREEDECPVCGNELPPGDDVRETHIQECIATRFSSTPSSAPSAPPRTSSIRTPTDAPEPPDGSTPLSSSARPRATSYRPRGMAVYRATEKDCVTEDGEPQECVICFEEFQPGDEMGRMECLCKFHRTCIRQWWDTKSAGSCPTHMLHE